MTALASKFWETASSGVAQKWLDRLLSPALVFWLGGAAAYSHAHDVDLIDAFTGWSQVDQALAVVAALFLVSGTTVAAELAEFRALRYSEGYWPPFASKMKGALVERHRQRLGEIDERRDELKAKFVDLNPEEVAEYSSLDRQRARYPRDPNLIMPTRLGNVMRAAETYAQRRYGLAAALMWPRLWLHVSSEVREEVTRSQGLLMSRVRLVVLGLAFCTFVIWVWWAPLVGIAMAWFAYLSLLKAATPFGHLLRSVFDLHHRSLYLQITGKDLADEHPMTWETGHALTMFLRRGTRS